MTKEETLKELTEIMQVAQQQLQDILDKHNYNMLDKEVLEKSREIDIIHSKIMSVQ